MVDLQLGEGVSHPVIIVEYDPIWPVMYEKERVSILACAGHRIRRLDHIGSTSVPGLGGKPVVDMLAGVDSAAEADECVQLLESVGYTDVDPCNEDPDWYYCLGKQRRTEPIGDHMFHLHLARYPSDFWKKHILFRDYLRTHADVAQDYYELKKELASKYRENRPAYTDAKTEFIESIVHKASSSNS